MANERAIAATEDLAAIFALSDAQLEMTAEDASDNAINDALRAIDEEKIEAIMKLPKRGQVVKPPPTDPRWSAENVPMAPAGDPG